MDRSQDPRSVFAAEQPIDLGDAHVTVLGCGSVGSVTAWALAGAGVGTLTLADRDRLEPDNLRRHLCDADDLGRDKPNAVADCLARRFSGLTLHPIELDFLEHPNRVAELVEATDIVISAVDNESARHLIDAVTREQGRSTIYAGVYGGGWASEMILIDAHADSPCYPCAARALGRIGVPITLPEAASNYTLPTSGRNQEEWARADLTSIAPVGFLIARLAVAVLAQQQGHPHLLREFQIDGALAWRYAFRAIPAWGLAPWQLGSVHVERLAGCPNCAVGLPGSAMLQELPEFQA